MTKLKLNFLNSQKTDDQLNLIVVLERYGQEICEYAKEYFTYTITTATSEGVLTDFSLYILAPEIGYEYRVVNVEIVNISKIIISHFILINKKTIKHTVNISNGIEEYSNKLKEALSHPLFNASLEFIVEQINLKRMPNIKMIAPSTMTKHTRGNVSIESNVTLTGMITGEVKILPLCVFTVHGTINGNIVLQKDAKLILYGIVNGNIFNYGNCEIFGAVNGKVIDKGGKVVLSKTALVKKK